jgi:hypothetical protein
MAIFAGSWLFLTTLKMHHESAPTKKHQGNWISGAGRALEDNVALSKLYIN